MKITPFVIVAVAIAVPLLALAQDPYAKALEDAMQKMVHGMHVEATGDPDRDFALMMIEHHRGAIDMARVELQYGDDPQMRELAGEIVAAQEQEIAEMEAWLEQHP